MTDYMDQARAAAVEATEMVLGCRMVTPSAQEAILAKQVGMSLEPYPGSLEGVCESCGRDVWIGPRQQEVLADLSATKKVTVYCLVCAAVAAQQMGQENVSVTSLGNTSKP